MPAAYQFVDRWFVPAPVEKAYEAIGTPLEYPAWWGDVFGEAGSDPGLPRPGRRNTITAKGFLPDKLHFVGQVVCADQHLTPVLRPLFRGNHNRTMRRGQQHVVEYVASR